MRRSEQLPVTVALVGCSKRKATSEKGIQAKDLYTGRLCRLGYNHAMERGWDVQFLSALHGVVDPYYSIPPYDYSMINIPRSQRWKWGVMIVNQLLELYPMQHLDIVFFAGQDYVKPVIDEAEEQDAYWGYKEPLKGLDLFARMRWFKANSTSSLS